MPKPAARYAIMFGLSGCYMPDSHYGVFEVGTRRELAALIRDALNSYDMPRRRMRDVNLRNLWHHIKHHGSSTAHFSLDAGHGSELAFSGLTEAEYAEQSQSED